MGAYLREWRSDGAATEQEWREARGGVSPGSASGRPATYLLGEHSSAALLDAATALCVAPTLERAGPNATVRLTLSPTLSPTLPLAPTLAPTLALTVALALTLTLCLSLTLSLPLPLALPLPLGRPRLRPDRDQGRHAPPLPTLVVRVRVRVRIG